MTDSLVAFLRRMLDAEQAEAEKLPDIDDYSVDPWAIQWEETGEWNSYGYLRIAKARVLAEVDAKQQLVARAEAGMSCGQAHPGMDMYHPDGHRDEKLLFLLAAPYADHADFKEEWRS